MAVFTKHLTQDPIPPSKRAPNRMIPPALDTIVLRCLEKSPDSRFQRVEDLQLALVEHLGGQSGVDSLLNSSRMQAMQNDLLAGSGRTDGMARTLLHGEVATRDEVTAFKRKLARQRWFSAGIGVVVLAGFAYGAMRAYRQATAKPPFAGLEEEPNNQAPEATHVPFGRSVRGMLGKRIDLERSDRDFFRIELPPNADTVSLTNTALPNMATCLWVYREGEVDPLGRYCTGGPGKSLSIPSLRLQPGPFLFVVMQDRMPYDGGDKPFVQENVSDAYELTVSLAAPDKTMEVEPNDVDSVATPAPAGGSVAGRFDWVGDIDLVCAWPNEATPSGRVRWKVIDAEERTRDRGAVLELTPIVDGRKSAPIRLHRAGAKGEATETDVSSPWTSEPFEVSTTKQQCVRLRLTGDPWAGNDAPVTPPISPEEWKVHVEQVD